MIPPLGEFALFLALTMAVVQGTFPLLGVARRRPDYIRLARPAAAGQFVFVACAFVALAYSFLTDDFSVQNVALNSNTTLPVFYKLAAAWGSHEGSLLFWCVVLATWTMAVSIGSRRLQADFSARVLGILGIISIGMLAFLISTSNPFARLNPVPLDGRDLNPLLQDPAMVLHPPMLYIGYGGFSVAFAFAIAALLSGQVAADWARWARPWILWAWMFLTIGITLGSWWSYYELGWGGWWFWDSVENSSLMPWLVGTALLHSLAVTEKRGLFMSWTLLLAICGFSLSLLGTFLTRSGVTISVHAFASDPSRGMFLLALIGAVTGGALLLYAAKAAQFARPGSFKLVSRESFLLLNNVLLSVTTLTVMFGTLYPLFLDALNLGKISVGPPYFAAAFLVTMLPLLVLLGAGMHATWQQMRPRALARRVLLPGLAVLVAAALVPAFVFPRVSALSVIGLMLGVWIIAASLWVPLHRVMTRQSAALPLAMWGMLVAHFGVGIFVLGVTATENFSIEMDLGAAVGDRVRIRDYEFQFAGLRPVSGSNFDALEGRFDVFRNGQPVATLRPQKRNYRVQTSTMTEAAIDSHWERDLFVALGEDLGGGRWSLRVQYKPMIRFVFVGPLIMALGGLLASLDRRYRRLAQAAAQQPVAVATAVSAGTL